VILDLRDGAGFDEILQASRSYNFSQRKSPVLSPKAAN
jgi:hypothetical protein